MQPPTNSYAREYGRHEPPQRKGLPDNAGYDRLVSDFKKSGPIKTIDLNENNAFKSKIAHVLKPQEQLTEFMARTGLGPVQAQSMTAEQITKFVAQSANPENDPNLSAWSPKRVPMHFLLED